MRPERNPVVERNLALLEKVMSYLLVEPHVIASLPDKFEMVILPSDDPELRLYNLELLDRYERENLPVVLVRLKSSTAWEEDAVRPDLYIPVIA